MNGRRLVKKTTRTLIRTTIWLILFVAVGVGTYKLTIAYYQGTGQYASASVDGKEALVKATTDEIAVNAIFAVDGDDGKVKHLLVEIFHSKTGKLDFITIPADSQYGMSKELYRTLSKETPNIPQIMTWEALPQYFSQVSAYQYGSMLLEESLGIHISFYTLMSEQTFKEYFEEAQVTSSDTFQSSRCYTLSTSTRNHIKKLTTALQIETELAEYYTKIQSNLSLSKRNTYISAYQNADYDNIGVYSLSMEEGTNQLSTEKKEWLKSLVNSIS